MKVQYKAGLLTLAGIAAAIASGVASAAITNTKHNLTSNDAARNRFNGTTEICVFCHTPHGSNTAMAAPPWNKTAPSTAYQVYNTSVSSTMDATMATDGNAANNGIGSVSLACLSCHDGTQAMNNMVNAPGSGVAGNTTAGNLNGTWTAGTGTGVITTGADAGKLGAGIANLTSDLRNDHPIGINYCGWTAITSSTVTCADSDFTQFAARGDGRAELLKASTIGGSTVWWVDRDANGTRNKTDIILYNRTFAGGTGPSVECASCHDPHTETTTFLRPENGNQNSQVCLACHTK